MHKAEAIRDKCFDLLEQIRQAGHINRAGKGSELPTVFPAATVLLGEDNPSQQNLSFIDWDLTVNIEVEVRSSLDDLDPLLLDVREQLHLAMMSDDTLGLDFVISVMPAGQSEILRSNEGDNFSAKTTYAWSVKYRTGLRNPSV